MKKQEFYAGQRILHSDPGHSWLEVSKRELRILGIKDKISTYSYQDGNKVYLEEDCDAGEYIQARRNQNTYFDVVVKRYKSDCFIRDLKAYR